MKVGDLVQFIAMEHLANSEDFEFYKNRSGLVLEINKDDNAGPNNTPRYSARILWSGKKHALREYAENMEIINESR